MVVALLTGFNRFNRFNNLTQHGTIPKLRHFFVCMFYEFILNMIKQFFLITFVEKLCTLKTIKTSQNLQAFLDKYHTTNIPIINLKMKKITLIDICRLLFIPSECPSAQSSTSAPIGALTCNFQPFEDIMADRPTHRRIDQKKGWFKGVKMVLYRACLRWFCIRFIIGSLYLSIYGMLLAYFSWQ